MPKLHHIIHWALTKFADKELDGSWSGCREREAVSLFTFGYLLKCVKAGSPLRHPTQIGIECAVPQLHPRGVLRKDQVCKDLIIWPRPRMTCWDKAGNPTIPPAVVMEWKFGSSEIHSGDVEWLQAFTKRYPKCTGYAVTANRKGADLGFLISCTRVRRGREEPKWLWVE